MQVTGKVTRKQYECTDCGLLHNAHTNHYGDIYPWCNKCMNVTVYKCLEELPEGWTKPAPWAMVKLGDVCKME